MFGSDRNRPIDCERAVVVDGSFNQGKRKPLPLGVNGPVCSKMCLTGADIVRDVRVPR
jgi:hypothetical protein